MLHRISACEKEYTPSISIITNMYGVQQAIPLSENLMRDHNLRTMQNHIPEASSIHLYFPFPDDTPGID